MAEVAKAQPVSYSSLVNPQSSDIVGLVAGEGIAAGDACRINAADGLVYRASGAAANANARVRGFAKGDASAGEPITLVTEGNFKYGSGLTPDTPLFLSGTIAGGLADGASTGGTASVAFALDSTRIRIRPGGLG